MWQYNYTNELTHYGVLGMKWGVRKKLNSGKHQFSVGFTKKRQDAYNKRDKAALKRRIKNNEQKLTKEQKKDDFSSVYRKERKRQKQQINSKRAVTVGRIFANNFLKNRQATLDGKPIRVSSGAEAVAKWLIDYGFYKTSDYS